MPLRVAHMAFIGQYPVPWHMCGKTSEAGGGGSAQPLMRSLACNDKVEIRYSLEAGGFTFGPWYEKLLAILAAP